MEYKQRYKEVFSQIHPMKNFDQEELYMKKSYNNITKKGVGIAVVAALLVSFCLTVYAANLFGLRDLLLPQSYEAPQIVEPEKEQPVTPVEPEKEQPSQPVDMISLVGFSNTPEAKAAAEWQAFLNTYDIDAALENIGNNVFAPDTSYIHYRVYNQEMADKLDEIIAKYGLKLHTSMLTLTPGEQLPELIGSENRAFSGYMYEDGTFKFDGILELAGCGNLEYQFQRCVRGSFTDIALNINDIGGYAEWSYTTNDGTPALLALSPYKSLIIVDLPDCFVTINVLAGTETPLENAHSFDAADLEHFADSFDFSVLTSAKSVNH